MSLRASVIIPAYNAEPFIARALESVRAQSLAVQDVVVAIDGSTDRTAEIARSLGATVLELPRGNVSIARNAAARAAQGGILMFLDADDWWEPTKVEAHLAVWGSGTEYGAVIDRVSLTTGEGAVKEVKGPDGEVGWEAFTDIANWTCGSAPSMRRETFEAIGGFNDQVRYLEDVDIVLRATHHAGKAFGIQTSHTHYFLSPGSASKRFVYPAEQVETMLSTWRFASQAQIRAFRRLCLLLAARRVPFPASLKFLGQAGWPVGDKMFWRCLAGSFKRIVEGNGD